MSLFLGIDFGTSTNVVTRWDESKKTAVPVPLGVYGAGHVFPNVIYYESQTNKIVGNDALTKGKQDPQNAVFAIKRQLESPDFRQNIPALGRSLSSEDIAADIFSWIKREAEKKFGGQNIDGAVISVPFAFQNRERKRIERAARQAGLNVLGLIEEPVAAALSFGIMEEAERGKAEKILVFDLGGGTFDVTIFDFQKQSDKQFAMRVLTTDGAKKLGGIDLDNLMVDKIIEKMEDTYPDYRLDTLESSLQEKDTFKMRQIAIEIKEILSEEEETDLYFVSDLSDELYLDETLTREDFEEWLEEFLIRIENVLDAALLDANLEAENIDRIIMVGGTSKIPAVNEKVREYFGKEPQQVGDLTLMVGTGAGIYCGLKYVDKSLDCNIAVGVSQNIGLKWGGRFFEMLPRNTLYGTPSELAILNLNRSPQKDLSIPIVQGNRIQNVKIGSISVPLKIRQSLIDGKLGVKLNTDINNGTVNYELWSVANQKSQKMLIADKAREE
jgi:molecular chaperone DnaK